MKFVRKMFKNEEGATAIEYGLIAALIAVAAIVAMGQLGNTLENTFNGVSTEMEKGNEKLPS
jgi:pilus assembly protein Flp/PilA